MIIKLKAVKFRDNNFCYLLSFFCYLRFHIRSFTQIFVSVLCHYIFKPLNHLPAIRSSSPQVSTKNLDYIMLLVVLNIKALNYYYSYCQFVLTFMFSFSLSKYLIDKPQCCIYFISSITTINFNYSKQVNYLLRFMITSAPLIIKFSRK